MKKFQPLLLIGATCVVLLAVLWATGLLNTGPRAEKGSPPPDSAKGPNLDATKQENQPTPQKLIVGKWQSQFGKMPIKKEYAEDGTVTEYPAFGQPKKGIYRLLNEGIIEYEWHGEQKAKEKTVQIRIGKDELSEITGDEWMAFTLKFRRVAEFSPPLSKEDPKKGEDQPSPQKVAAVEATLTFKKHEASVESVAISPDGMLIASGGGDGVVLIWERATGKVKHKLDTLNRNEGVRGIAFSPDGSTVVCGSKLWNVETGEQRRGHFPGERAVISPDGKLLITAIYEEVHAWDLVEDKKVFSKKTPGRISSIAISPDGKLIASGDHSNYVKVWDATTGEPTFSHKDSRAQVYSVAFSPDSTILAVDSGRNYPTLFDLKTSEKVPFKGEMAKAGFSHPLPLPDGKHLACVVSKDHSVRLMDLPTGQERLILKGHTDLIKALAVSPDGKWMASASQDHTVKVWDVSSVVAAPLKLAMPQPENTVFKKRDAVMPVLEFDVSQVTDRGSYHAISPDAKHLVIDASGELQLWNIGEKKLILRNDVAKFKIPRVAFNFDSQLFAFCVGDRAKVWRIPTVEELALQKPSITPDKADAKIDLHFTEVVFSKDGKKVAVCGRYTSPSFSDGGILAIWDTANGTLLTTITDSQARNGFNSMAFNPAADRIAFSFVSSFRSDSTVSEVRLWSLTSARQLNSLKTNIYVDHLTWNEDGSLLAIAGRQNNSRSAKTLFWDTKSERGTFLAAIGRLLASGKFVLSYDNNGARLLDAEGGRPLFTFEECLVRPMDSGKRLAVIKGSQVTIWRIDTETLELVRQERLSKVAKPKEYKFTIKSGYEVPQEGFWIDAAISPAPTDGHRLVITVPRAEGFKQTIKVKVSSKDELLSIVPAIHEIKADDQKTLEFVSFVESRGFAGRFCEVTVTTDPPSDAVNLHFTTRKKEKGGS